MPENTENLTQLLQAFAEGDRSKADELMRMIYPELKKLASLRLKSEYEEISLCTTDLVHEAYLKLVDQQNKTWENRAHFFACAATAMRQILVDRARKQKAVRRGGGKHKISIEDVPLISDKNFEMTLMVNDALEKLEAMDPRQGRIAELRYYAGLTIEETAHELGISIATVKREWQFAKAWLVRELEEGNDYGN